MTLETSLDPEDQQILAGLTPEGAEPGTPATHTPQEEDPNADAPAPAPAPADAPAVSPAPPAPAPAPADTPAPSPAPTDAPAPGPAAPAPSPSPAPAEPQGDTRAALRAARRNEKRLRDQLEARERELEELRAGKTATTGVPEGEDDPLTMSEERIAEIAENFPMQANAIRRTRELHQQVEELKARTAPAPAPAGEWEPPLAPPQVQEVIDQVPQLLAWQHSQADQQKFQMAAEFDASLLHDPLWKGKSAVERFTEAARRTEAALGTGAPAPAPAPRQDPNAVIAAAPANAPAGISDFRGGGPANAPALDLRRMSDEEILASLTPEP